VLRIVASWSRAEPAPVLRDLWLVELRALDVWEALGALPAHANRCAAAEGPGRGYLMDVNSTTLGSSFVVFLDHMCKGVIPSSTVIRCIDED